MSTSGAYGFIKNGVEKIGYNQYDSYIDDLGIKIVKFINETTKEEMEQIFDKIILVDDKNDATDEQNMECEKWFASFTHGEKNYWYDLLMLMEGNLRLYKEGVLHMLNAKSRYVDYKYIINLDNNEFEIYKNDLETKAEKLIAVYQLDKVTERDIKLLLDEPLEEEEIKHPAWVEKLRTAEGEKMLLKRSVELYNDEEFMKYYCNEFHSGEEDFFKYLKMVGIESIVDVKELNKITDAKEREKILSQKINKVYREIVFNRCIFEYADIIG